jgi:hypothetical protein
MECEIFCHQGSRRTQTQQQEARGINEKRQWCAHPLHEVMEQVWYAQHMQGGVTGRPRSAAI